MTDTHANHTIAIESSTWNNLGDAFYQNSLINQFRNHFPDYNIVSFDGPFQRAFRPGSFEKFGYDSRFRVDAKHFVFSGPIMGKVFMKEYAPLIQSIKERGRSYSLMSLHASADDVEMDTILQFLREYPPAAIQTRDNPTFEKVKGIASTDLDGICFAFWVNSMKHLPVYSVGNPYICSSYYRGYEPEFSIDNPQADDLLTSGFVTTQAKAMKQSSWRIARLLEYRRKSPSTLGKWDIVRPVHAFTRLPVQTFSKENSYITYNPDNFLAIYKYCDGVLSDRVHAGVAGLSFGKPVRVEKVDTRFALFEKLPIQHEAGFMKLAPGALEPFFKEVSNWLLNDFAQATGL
jgi:hypothetical protein